MTLKHGVCRERSEKSGFSTRQGIRASEALPQRNIQTLVCGPSWTPGAGGVYPTVHSPTPAPSPRIKSLDSKILIVYPDRLKDDSYVYQC